MICKIYCTIANMSNLHCQLPEARNALPTADCVSAEQTKVAKPNHVATDCVYADHISADCVFAEQTKVAKHNYVDRLIVFNLIIFLLTVFLLIESFRRRSSKEDWVWQRARL